MNNITPLISIIVPAYNVAPYLSKCLDSILSQSYKNIEIIIVDDGSEDTSGEIADRYTQTVPDIVKCIHILNEGVTNARLVGVCAARGEWIGFVDGDDEIEPDMYERLLNNAILNHADISHCGYQIIVNRGERIHYFHNTGKVITQNRFEGLRDLLEGSFVEPSLCNKLFHKNLFDLVADTESIDRSIRVYEDLLLNYLLFSKANKSIYEDFCPYHYLAHATTVTRTEFQAYKCLDPVRVMHMICSQCDSDLREIAIHKYLQCCGTAYSILIKKREFKTICLSIRNDALSYRAYWGKMRFNTQIKLYLIFYMPKLYNFIYGVYTRYFQNRIYE